MVTMVYTWVVVMTIFIISTSVTDGDVSISNTPDSGTKITQVGEYVSFHCTDTKGDEVEWVFDSILGEIILQDGLSFTLTHAQDDSGYKLYMSIDAVTKDDSGDYTCRSKSNPSHKQMVRLTVLAADASPPSEWVPPRIVQDGVAHDTVEVEVNQLLRLRCQGGNEHSVLELRHNGNTIMVDTQNFITNAQDLPTRQQVAILTREHAVVADSGEYTCKDVTFPDPHGSVAVEVIEQPTARVEIIEPSGPQSKVRIGDNFIIKCQSSIHTTIEWYHGDEQLKDEQGGFIVNVRDDTDARMRTSALTKEGVELADAGTYRCVNVNSAQEQASIEMDVKTQGDGDGFLEGLFSGVPSVMASALFVLLAALCTLI